MRPSGAGVKWPAAIHPVENDAANERKHKWFAMPAEGVSTLTGEAMEEEEEEG